MPTFDAARMLGGHQGALLRRVRGPRAGIEGRGAHRQVPAGAFTKIGLQPGNTDGTFVQPLPLVGITATNTRPLTVTGHGKKTTFRWRDDLVAWTKRVDRHRVDRELGADLRRLRRHRARVQVGRLQGRRRQGQDDPRAGQRSADSQRVRSLAARLRRCSTARR